MVFHAGRHSQSQRPGWRAIRRFQPPRPGLMPSCSLKRRVSVAGRGPGRDRNLGDADRLAQRPPPPLQQRGSEFGKPARGWAVSANCKLASSRCGASPSLAGRYRIDVTADALVGATKCRADASTPAGQTRRWWRRRRGPTLENRGVDGTAGTAAGNRRAWASGWAAARRQQARRRRAREGARGRLPTTPRGRAGRLDDASTPPAAHLVPGGC